MPIAWGAELVGAACLIDRSGGRAEIGVPLVALATLDLPDFAPDEVPSELAAIPAIKAGEPRPFEMTADSPPAPIFHLSFPVRDLEEALGFYTGTLGGGVPGRREDGWADVALFGAHLTLQHVPERRARPDAPLAPLRRDAGMAGMGAA